MDKGGIGKGLGEMAKGLFKPKKKSGVINAVHNSNIKDDILQVWTSFLTKHIVHIGIFNLYA